MQHSVGHQECDLVIERSRVVRCLLTRDVRAHHHVTNQQRQLPCIDPGQHRCGRASGRPGGTGIVHQVDGKRQYVRRAIHTHVNTIHLVYRLPRNKQQSHLRLSAHTLGFENSRGKCLPSHGFHVDVGLFIRDEHLDIAVTAHTSWRIGSWSINHDVWCHELA